jgi:hypothetical protein
MKNAEMIEEQGRQMFFTDLWQRASEVMSGLPADTTRLRLVVELDTGHRLITVPMEAADAPFFEMVMNGVANLAAAKSSAVVVKKKMDGIT